jgi:hypothetical protein
MFKSIIVVMAFLLVAVMATLAQTYNLQTAKSANACDISVTVESGVAPSYVDEEAGYVVYPHSVALASFEVEKCANRRASYGFRFSQYVSTKHNPSDGTETGIMMFSNIKLKEKANLYLETGKFVYTDVSLYEFRAEVSQSFELGKDAEAELTDAFVAYQTTNKKVLSGGVLNKVSLALKKGWGKTSVTVTPAISIDNNPFDLGKGRLASIGFLTGRVEYAFSNKVSVYVSGMLTNKLFGDTDRGFNKTWGVGFIYHFK